MLTSIYSWTLFNCFSLPLKLDLILVNLVFAPMTTARRADFSELTLSGVFGFTVVVKLELRSDWPHRLWSFSCGVSGRVSLKQFLIVVLLISKMCL